MPDRGPDWKAITGFVQAHQQKRIADAKIQSNKIKEREQASRKADRDARRRERQQEADRRDRDRRRRLEHKQAVDSQKLRLREEAMRESRRRWEVAALAKLDARLGRLVKDSRLQRAVRSVQKFHNKIASQPLRDVAVGTLKYDDVLEDQLREIRGGVSQLGVIAREIDSLEYVAPSSETCQQLEDVYNWLSAVDEDYESSISQVAAEMISTWERGDSVALSVRESVNGYADQCGRDNPALPSPWRSESAELIIAIGSVNQLVDEFGELTQRSGVAFEEAESVGSRCVEQWWDILEKANRLEQSAVARYWCDLEGREAVNDAIGKTVELLGARKWLEVKAEERSDIVGQVVAVRHDLLRDVSWAESMASAGLSCDTGTITSLRGDLKRLDGALAGLIRLASAPSVMLVIAQANHLIDVAAARLDNGLGHARARVGGTRVWTPKGASADEAWCAWFSSLVTVVGIAAPSDIVDANSLYLVPVVARGGLPVSSLMGDKAVEGGSDSAVAQDDSASHLAGQSHFRVGRSEAPLYVKWKSLAQWGFVGACPEVQANWFTIGRELFGAEWGPDSPKNRESWEADGRIAAAGVLQELRDADLESFTPESFGKLFGVESNADKSVELAVARVREAAIKLKSAAGNAAAFFASLTAAHPSVKSKRMLCAFTAILLGGLGVHRMLLKDWSGAAIRAFASVLCFPVGIVIGLIEGAVYLSQSDDHFMAAYQVKKRAWF